MTERFDPRPQGVTIERIRPGLIRPMVAGWADHNVASRSITAPEKRGFFLGCTTIDNSVSTLCFPVLTGWNFTMLAFFPDATGGQNIAFWLGRPNLNLLAAASGTTFTYTNSVVGQFANAVFRQYEGPLVGEVVDVAGGQGASATSCFIGRPTSAASGSWRFGTKVIGLAGVVFQSGGSGINASSDAAWPDVAAPVGLGALRLMRDITPTVNSGTTFSSSRNARWSGGYLVLR